MCVCVSPSVTPSRCLCPPPPVLQEAVSTGDPEMVQLVLQYRDYQRATRRLAGIPELLSKLRRVRNRGGHRAAGSPPDTAPPSPVPLLSRGAPG